MVEQIYDRLTLIIVFAVLFAAFGLGAAYAEHWLKRRLYFTALYAWTLIVGYVLIDIIAPDVLTAMPAGVERVLTWTLILAVFLAFMAAQAPEHVFEKYVGRTNLNSVPQRYGSFVWWVGVGLACFVLALLATGFPNELRSLFDIYDDPTSLFK